MIEKILLDRENRSNYQKELINKYKLPLITIRVNYPGNIKNTILYENILDEFKDIFFNYDILHFEKYESLDGNTLIFVINEEAIKLKKYAIYIEENHFLGRLMDIDVIGIDFQAINRVQCNTAIRKCYICNNYAKYCARSRSHSIDEIINYIKEKYINYLAFKISNKATKSLLLEVATYPSFGLVSQKNSGAHKDMDFYTFIDSIYSLNDGIIDVVRASYSDENLEIIFKKVREIGKSMEISMFNKTKGVNTHKGLIFLICIVILVVSNSYFDGSIREKNIYDILIYKIKEVSKDIFSDFKNIENKQKLTHGEKIYLKYGIRGIREEVYNGLSDVFKIYLPFYLKSIKEGYDLNFSRVRTLLKIMSKLDDSTILYRHNLKILEEIKKKSKDLLLTNDINKILEFENYCIENNISPGGSADILAITIFIASIFEN